MVFSVVNCDNRESKNKSTKNFPHTIVNMKERCWMNRWIICLFYILRPNHEIFPPVACRQECREEIQPKHGLALPAKTFFHLKFPSALLSVEGVILKYTEKRTLETPCANRSRTTSSFPVWSFPDIVLRYDTPSNEKHGIRKALDKSVCLFFQLDVFVKSFSHQTFLKNHTTWWKIMKLLHNV